MLLEVTIALTLFSISALCIIILSFTTHRLNAEILQRTKALNLACNLMENPQANKVHHYNTDIDFKIREVTIRGITLKTGICE